MRRRMFRELPRSIIWKGRWRRVGWPLIVIAVAIAISLLDRGRQAPVSDDWQRYHDKTFAVARVIDGDTFVIHAPDDGKSVTRIRLWGVDTPETGRGSQPLMHFGAEAKEFAQETLTGREVHVLLSPDKSRGKYGRLLAYVYLQRGGVMFNELLIEEGYAYADTRFRHPFYDRFAAAEKDARRRGVGLWAEVTVDKMPAWKQRREGD